MIVIEQFDVKDRNLSQFYRFCLFYHNFTYFNVKNKINYNEAESFTISSVISGSYLFDPAYQINIEMNFIFDDIFNRYTILKFKL